MQTVDMVVAQHAVAKVSGTVDGFMLVTGVLAPQEHPTLVLANCALHILRIARQVTSVPGCFQTLVGLIFFGCLDIHSCIVYDIAKRH